MSEKSEFDQEFQTVGLTLFSANDSEGFCSQIIVAGKAPPPIKGPQPVEEEKKEAPGQLETVCSSSISAS